MHVLYPGQLFFTPCQLATAGPKKRPPEKTARVFGAAQRQRIKSLRRIQPQAQHSYSALCALPLPAALLRRQPPPRAGANAKKHLLPFPSPFPPSLLLPFLLFLFFSPLPSSSFPFFSFSFPPSLLSLSLSSPFLIPSLFVSLSLPPPLLFFACVFLLPTFGFLEDDNHHSSILRPGSSSSPVLSALRPHLFKDRSNRERERESPIVTQLPVPGFTKVVLALGPV